MTATTPNNINVTERTSELFKEQQISIVKHTSHVFARLMIFQWLAGVLAALLISPRAWAGTSSQVHIHVWAAIFLGALITSVPVAMAFLHPERTLTRHAVGIGQ